MKKEGGRGGLNSAALTDRESNPVAPRPLSSGVGGHHYVRHLACGGERS